MIGHNLKLTNIFIYKQLIFLFQFFKFYYFAADAANAIMQMQCNHANAMQ